MRVLVCGGAGFIGSHLVDRLVAQGSHVTVVDDLSTGRAERLRDAVDSGRCELVRMDITDAGLPAVMKAAEPEAVVNLAAQISVRASVEDPVADARANVLGTVSVLEAARLAGARKVVLASSVAVYGPVELMPVSEATPVNPLSPYAVSKLSGEFYLRQFHDLHGMETTTLVLTNTYGPRQDPHGEAGVVAIFAEAMLAGRPTRIFGAGDNVRDYVYVEDVAEAFARAIGPEAAGERINIGTGVGTSDNELHRTIAEATGYTGVVSLAPERPGDLKAMIVDARRAGERLSWKPQVPLAEGIARTVAAMRAGVR